MKRAREIDSDDEIIQPRRKRSKKKPVYGPWQYPYGKYAKQYRTQAIERVGPRGSEGSLAYWGADAKSATAEQLRRRQLMRYKGKGDYRSLAKWGLRGLGAMAGGAAGGYAGGLSGGLSGAQRGWDTGAAVSKYLGFGDYGAVVANSLIGPASQRRIAVNPSNNSGDIIFDHTEFISNVVVTTDAAGSSPFQVQSYPLNPGLEGTFPFLSQLAQNFTLYELQGLVFQYKPSSGEGGSTGTNSLGKVILATDYDPSALPFTNTQAMENYDHSSSAKPSVGIHHGVETASGQRLTNQLYIRVSDDGPGPAAPGQKDKILTDIGLFQVATEGVPVASAGSHIIGELWVSYRVKLSRASLRSTQAAVSTNFDLYYLTSNGGAIPYTTTTYLSEPPSTTPPAGTLYRVADESLGSEILWDVQAFTGVAGGAATLATGIRFPRNVVAGMYRVTIYGLQLAADYTPTTLVHTENCTVGVPLVATKPFVEVDAAGPYVNIDLHALSGYNYVAGAPTTTITFWVNVLAPDNAQASFTLAWEGSGATPVPNIPATDQLFIGIEQSPLALAEVGVVS